MGKMTTQKQGCSHNHFSTFKMVCISNPGKESLMSDMQAYFASL